MIDQIQRWSSLAGLPATVADAGPPFRVRLSLEDIRPPMVVEVVGPAGGDDPYRFNTGFDLPSGAASGLAPGRLGEIVEAAVLGRSALADARPRSDSSGVEMIAVIYPDGLTRHTFMTAIYECQKLRQIITRDVEAALVAESALASLLTLAETSEDLAATVSPPAPGIPGEAFPVGVPSAPATPEPASAWGTPDPGPPAPAAPEPPSAWSTPDPGPGFPSAPAAPPSPTVPTPTVSDPLFSTPPPASPMPPAEPPEPPPAPTWDPPPLPSVPPPLPPDLPPRPDSGA